MSYEPVILRVFYMSVIFSQTDRLFALSRLKQSGAFLTTTEGVLLQLVQDAKHPNFKEVPVDLCVSHSFIILNLKSILTLSHSLHSKSIRFFSCLYIKIYSVCIIIRNFDNPIIFLFQANCTLILYLIIYNWYIIVHEAWNWKTPYIQVCIIIKQVFFYR